LSLLTKLKTMLLDDDDALFFDFVVVESLRLTFVGGDLGGEIACGFVTFSSLGAAGLGSTCTWRGTARGGVAGGVAEGRN
jgi:hypothetical protein